MSSSATPVINSRPLVFQASESATYCSKEEKVASLMKKNGYTAQDPDGRMMQFLFTIKFADEIPWINQLRPNITQNELCKLLDNLFNQIVFGNDKLSNYEKIEEVINDHFLKTQEGCNHIQKTLLVKMSEIQNNLQAENTSAARNALRDLFTALSKEQEALNRHALNVIQSFTTLSVLIDRYDHRPMRSNEAKKFEMILKDGNNTARQLQLKESDMQQKLHILREKFNSQLVSWLKVQTSIFELVVISGNLLPEAQPTFIDLSKAFFLKPSQITSLYLRGRFCSNQMERAIEILVNFEKNERSKRTDKKSIPTRESYQEQCRFMRCFKNEMSPFLRELNTTIKDLTSAADTSEVLHQAELQKETTIRENIEERRATRQLTPESEELFNQAADDTSASVEYARYQREFSKRLLDALNGKLADLESVYCSGARHGNRSAWMEVWQSNHHLTNGTFPPIKSSWNYLPSESSGIYGYLYSLTASTPCIPEDYESLNVLMNHS